MKPTGPILNQVEMDSACWQKLKARCTERLEALRHQLESLGTPAAERDALVCRIDELKQFLRLGTPAADK